MKARKRFGQHFLKDTFILQQFTAAVAPTPTDHLVEIGPGHGAFTDYLIDRSARLDLIEIDRDLIPLLKKKYHTHANLHQADVLDFDFHQLKGNQKMRLVGNLPYNISTPLLFHLFDQIDCIQDMHFLLQKEVVDRLIAKPGEHHYGRFSIMTQFYCHAEWLLMVPPEAFQPPPKVTSCFVRLVPRSNPLTLQSQTHFKNLVREVFNYRRKSLSNSLKKWMTAEQMEKLDINPKSRPQELSLEDYIRISNALCENIK